MAYRLPLRKPTRRALHRVADAQLRRAIAELTHARGDRTVHVARRRVKKVRALLQLVAAGRSGRRAERTLRTVSRMLGPVADGEASARTFARICASSPPALSRSAQRMILEMLSRHQAQIARQSAPVRAKAARLLARVRTDIDDMRMRGHGFGLVEGGLRAGVRRARQGMRSALERRTDAAFHAWRRRVKVQWLQLRLLEARTDGRLRPLATQLETLDGLLGEHHDIALLEPAVMAAPDIPRRHAAACRRVLRRRKTTLRRQAAAIGMAVHAARPREVVAGIRTAWRDSKARAISLGHEEFPPLRADDSR